MIYIQYDLIGVRIREIRKRCRMSQEYLAEAAGLSVGYISSVENGKKKVSLSALLQISHSLQVTLDDLLVGNQLPLPSDYLSDFSALLKDCTPAEKQLLYGILKAARDILLAQRTAHDDMPVDLWVI